MMLPLILPSKKLVNGYRAIKTFLVLNGKSDQEIQDITKYDHNAVKFHIQLLFEDFLESQKLGRN